MSMFMLEPTNKYTHPSYLPFFPISFPQLSSKGILLKWIALTVQKSTFTLSLSVVEVVRYCFNLKECSAVIYQFLQGFQCKKAVSMENLKTGLITQAFSISSMTQAVSHSNLQFWLLLVMQTRTPHILKCLSYPRTILVS